MKFDLKPIDPIEALIAAIGVYPVLDREPGKVRMAKIHEARDISAKVETLAKQLAADELQEIPVDEVNYRAVLAKLIEEKFTIDRGTDIAALFPSQASGEATKYLIAIGDIIKTLAKKFPIPVYTTFAGSSTMVPSDVATWRWASLLQVMDSPLDVFPLIATGALTSNQAKAVRQAFPTLTQAIDSALQQAVEAARAKDKTYELPSRAEFGMRIWLDRPRYSPAMMKTFQDNVKRATEEQKTASAPQGKSAEPGVQDLTQAQKSAYMTTR
jgi:hypothetical protein